MLPFFVLCTEEKGGHNLPGNEQVGRGGRERGVERSHRASYDTSRRAHIRHNQPAAAAGRQQCHRAILVTREPACMHVLLPLSPK
ncbi:hypothetical protein X798_02594 [Onchocerca flexuosa]|uniref:Uncharacterized protein n=2 Tax=Onchocerca flexuosa TaxID=387005 RepID=A0A183I089_9BILA|nr:hypothetical protein X798_02594 [Onchocerca flexuosa]VDP13028.1 unnamed protein product [Onchocerca flexuosa]